MNARSASALFVSLQPRAKLLAKLLVVFAVVASVHAVVSIAVVAGVVDYAAVELALDLCMAAYAVSFVATVVAFARFQSRAYRNTTALGRPVKEFSESSMSWWYFVPVLNLVRPYQAMRAVWDASRPRSAEYGAGTWASAPEVSSWWTAWVIAQVLGRLANPMAERAVTLDELVYAAVIEIAGEVALVAAALLLRNMALQLADLQQYAAADED